jgi:pimeloyl-ACP methyl ester carboxylesterase
MNRRKILRSATFLLAASHFSGRVGTTTNPRKVTLMTNRPFVLVHGALHGGWCWELVCARLEAAGRVVYAPTLTGLAERAGEFSADIGLDTHVTDIVRVIEQGDLRDIVLVGHSYGGMVVTGVADAVKERIAHIVYLDAAVPKDGESMLSYGESRPAEVIDATVAALRALSPEGDTLPAFPPETFGVPVGHPRYEWVGERLTPHPLKTWTDPIKLRRGGSDGLARSYIFCNGPALETTQFPYIAAQVKNDPSWNYHELATGHDAMVTDAEGVTALLLAV